jgi:hypothetical protein
VWPDRFVARKLPATPAGSTRFPSPLRTPALPPTVPTPAQSEQPFRERLVGRATPSQAYVVRRREGEPGPKRVNRPNRPPPTRPGCEIWMQVKAGKAGKASE